MDILAQYDKQYPEQKQAPQKTYGTSSEDVGPIIQFIFRISGGRIKNKQQANKVLFGIIALAIGLSLYVIFSSSGDVHPLIKAPPPETIVNNLRSR